MNALVHQWSLSQEDGQLLYGLAARGTFNPEGGAPMPKESPVSSISNADWNALVQHWKSSHVGTNPEVGTAVPKESPVGSLDDALLLPVCPAIEASTPNGYKSMISGGPECPETCILLTTSCYQS